MSGDLSGFRAGSGNHPIATGHPLRIGVHTRRCSPLGNRGTSVATAAVSPHSSFPLRRAGHNLQTVFRCDLRRLRSRRLGGRREPA